MESLAVAAFPVTCRILVKARRATALLGVLLFFLKDLTVRNSAFTTLHSYAYTLRASGHRSGVAESTGRTVGYTLDNLYRLTQEAVTGDPSLVNGTSDWAYDLVGNRLSQSSTLDQVFNAVESYSDNNWLDSHSYDANGNTTRSAQLQQASVTLNDSYDWRNRLIRREQSDGTVIEIVYDGFGDRVKKMVTPFGQLGEATWFLVDRNNLTGYAQVVEEIGQGDELQVVYSYGLDLISQDRRDRDGSGNFTQSFYLYDGLGTVRSLADDTGVISDTYTYDAWGVPVASTGTTVNAFRFTGEQWDADLEMYFLRARYLNVATGRFHTMDTFEGVSTDPVTLHKYLYANANPAHYVDPTGLFSLTETSIVNSIIRTLSKLARPVIRFAGKTRKCKTANKIYKAAQGAAKLLPKCRKTLAQVRSQGDRVSKTDIILKMSLISTELVWRQIYWAFGCTKTYKNKNPKGHLQATRDLRKALVTCTSHYNILCSMSSSPGRRVF